MASEVLSLVAELQAAFGRTLGEPTKNIWIREFSPFDAEDGKAATQEIIRNEERFPSIATMYRFLGEADRQKGIKTVAEESRHLAKLRDVPYDAVLRGHVEMCRENLEVTGDAETWGTRIDWCEELLRGELR